MCFCLLGLLISLYFGLYIISIIILFSQIGVLFLLIINKSRIICNWKKEPKLLNDSTRNYQCLELGYQRTGGDNVGLDLTQKYTNLYSDFLLLKRYYSLVKSGGKIIVNMDATKAYMLKQRPTVFSLCMLHPVTLMELGKFYYIYEIKLKEILNPLIFFFNETTSYIIKKRKTNICNKILMRDMENFCNERNLKIVWYINGSRI